MQQQQVRYQVLSSSQWQWEQTTMAFVSKDVATTAANKLSALTHMITHHCSDCSTAQHEQCLHGNTGLLAHESCTQRVMGRSLPSATPSITATCSHG